MYNKIKLFINTKLKFTGLFTKIFTKSNISKIIIIFIVGFVSRVLVGHFYGVNLYLEYLNTISITYYALFAIFVVILSEIVSYFELNIIPYFIIDSYTFIVKALGYVLKTLVDIGKTVSFINGKIYYFVFT